MDYSPDKFDPELLCKDLEYNSKSKIFSVIPLVHLFRHFCAVTPSPAANLLVLLLLYEAERTANN